MKPPSPNQNSFRVLVNSRYSDYKALDSTPASTAQQPRSMQNYSNMDEDDGHARVLRALHGEILAHGLVSAQGIVSGAGGLKICDAPDQNRNNNNNNNPNKDVEVEAATATAATATTTTSTTTTSTAYYYYYGGA